MSNPDYSVQLVLTEIVTFGAGVTPTLRLDLKAQKGLKSGQALVIQVLEAATQSGEATEIDRFSVRVVQQGATWVFRDVVDPRPSTHPVRGESYHLADHFKLVFAGAEGAEGAQVCILSELGSGVSRPAYISVKAIAKDRPLESSCTAQRVMRHFRARLMAYQFRKGDGTLEEARVASSPTPSEVAQQPKGSSVPHRKGIEVRGSEEFRQVTLQHIERIREGGKCGADLIQKLESSKNTTVIIFGKNDRARPVLYSKYPFWLLGVTVAGDDVVVTYNPYNRTAVTAKYDDGGKLRPPWVVLAHELFHVLDFYSGEDYTWVFERGNIVNGELVKNAWEASAVLGENRIRAENNLPLRKGY
ncbi:MAG: hypothetical protein IPO40_09255 [Fibrobacteres bacterium]|nr:hypothetical protein [Fibrobacterota bacterium]